MVSSSQSSYFEMHYRNVHRFLTAVSSADEGTLGSGMYFNTIKLADAINKHMRRLELSVGVQLSAEILPVWVHSSLPRARRCSTAMWIPGLSSRSPLQLWSLQQEAENTVSCCVCFLLRALDNTILSARWEYECLERHSQLLSVLMELHRFYTSTLADVSLICWSSLSGIFFVS